MIGRHIAHYRILERLGAGGMGEVYLAEDTRLRRRVAVKVLPPEMAADPERLERFTREALAVAALNHPNIVTLHSIEEADGLPLLVMELIEGETLTSFLPIDGVDERTFFRLAIPLADALAAAHDKGVTHRDLKPSNIMIVGGERDPRVKIVDFGIAKHRQEAEAQQETAIMGHPDPFRPQGSSLTRAGQVIGTFPYMAPEQVKGIDTDSRADIFSLGVILYEMATGRRPFAGDTQADLISSILRDTPPAVSVVRGEELPADLEEILDGCLAKEPEQRFQSAAELRDALVLLEAEARSRQLLAGGAGSRRRRPPWRKKRREESLAPRSDASAASAIPPTAGEGNRWRRPGALAAAGLGLLVILLAVYFLRGRLGDRAAQPASLAEPASSGAEPAPVRTSLAVMHFQNLAQDADLEWLTTGLTDMMVTNLSQSAELRVLSTDRLYEVLQALDKLDSGLRSAEEVREFASASEVERVLKGSFVRAGETLRIAIRVQDAASGDIVFSRQAEGLGEASLFTLVDALSRGIRERFEQSPEAQPELDRDLAEVTTASLEAYRYYDEGMNLRWQLKLVEAIPLFEKAVEIDPGFALAYARLVSIFDSLGRTEAAREAARKAYENADRLPPAERAYIEGEYHGRRRASYGRAIEAYRRALELDPDHGWAHYGLAHLYAYLELFPEAIEQYEALLPRGRVYPATYHSLANMQTARGRPKAGDRYVEELLSEQPERWLTHVVYGWHMIQSDRLQEALKAYERGGELRPGSPFLALGRFRIFFLMNDLAAAEAEARKMLAAGDSFWRWQGAVELASLRLHQGRAREALRWLGEAIDSYDDSDPLVAAARCWQAEVYLFLDQPEAAYAAAAAARREAPGEWPEWEGLFWGALSAERLGRSTEADRFAEELAAKGELLPGQVEERFSLRLQGLLALERGEPARAQRLLAEAVALLPPRGVYYHRHRRPDHVPLRAALADAARLAGDRETAVREYEAVTASTLERIWFGVSYARSFYHLAGLYQDAGEGEKARGAYLRFLELWGEGDFDSEWVSRARAYVSASGG